jgi:hypothetical protein
VQQVWVVILVLPGGASGYGYLYRLYRHASCLEAVHVHRSLEFRLVAWMCVPRHVVHSSQPCQCHTAKPRGKNRAILAVPCRAGLWYWRHKCSLLVIHSTTRGDAVE